VGAPFTNFDLAKLLNKDQGTDLGIVLDTRDVLAGDVERADVADSVVRMLGAAIVGMNICIKPTYSIWKLPIKPTISICLPIKPSLYIGPSTYSIINKPGEAPDEGGWGRLLSLFTVGEDVLTTRSS
jgi:hypothetical protein